MNRIQELFEGIKRPGCKTSLPFALLLLLISCAPQSRDRPLTLAVAANMQFAITELTEAFTRTSGIPCNVTISSSGKLAAQIREGAPFDVFLSADMKYPEALYQEGFAKSPPVVYAYGSLIMWTMLDTISPDLGMLTDTKIKHIAIANPETAPYGAAAQEVLITSGIWNFTEPKMVYGENIAQVNQFVYSGAAEIGFTAKAAVLSPLMQGKGQWVEIPQDQYTPIAQGAILLDRSVSYTASGKAFFDYLLTDAAAQILLKYGYDITADLSAAIQ